MPRPALARRAYQKPVWIAVRGHVDTEGLMGGTSFEAIAAIRAATTRRVTAAGGITTRKEIDDLDALGVDAVVGMAIYTGTLNLEP